jgi:hypothetical protein
MCNKEALVGYLYDDLGPDTREAFEAHLAGCAECRAEVAELRETRQHLASWSPPEPAFNFRVVRGAASAPPPPRRFGSLPGWALAAAASLLVLAGAAAIANVQVEYRGLVIRAGWSAPDGDASTADARPAAAVPVSSEDQRAALATAAKLAEVEARMLELERAQAERVERVAAAARPGITTPELRKVLSEFENQLRAEMAVQIRNVWTDFNAARASDFQRVQQTFAPEIHRNQRSIENLLYLASQR